MEINPSILERIFNVADSLYEAGGKTSCPTVDTVRKQAKVNMNDACSGMREWRKTLIAKIDVAAIDMPDALQSAVVASVQSLWSHATSLASEALQAAQAAWQAERRDMEILSEQVASAFETQAQDLENKEAQLAQNQLERDGLATDLGIIQQRSNELQHENVTINAVAEQAQLRHIESEKRIHDLRRELDHVYDALTNANNTAAELRQTHACALSELRQQLEQLAQRAIQEGLAHHQELAQAREDAATLRGRLQALEQPKRVKRQLIPPATKQDNGNCP